jgi:hypothetical protein
MRTLSVFVLLAISPSTVCLGDEADPYGAKGPCAYLFELPGGKCLDGVFTLETEIGPGQKIVTSKVTASSETPKSSGSVAPVH